MVFSVEERGDVVCMCREQACEATVQVCCKWSSVVLDDSKGCFKYVCSVMDEV